MSQYINVFDLETTGLDKTKDQIIQIAIKKIDKDTFETIDTYHSYVQPMGSYTIGYGAYFKHGITTDFLKDKPFLKDIAQDIINFFGDDDVAGYNSNRFDIAFLKNELNKYGFDIDFTKRNCYDMFKEEQRRNGNKLEDTFKRYTGKTMSEFGLEAHNAMSDIDATIEIFRHQNKISPVIPEKMYGEDGVITDMEFCGEIKPCFNIGKYHGVSIEFVAKYDQNYLNWCVNKSGFLENTKNIIRQYIND